MKNGKASISREMCIITKTTKFMDTPPYYHNTNHVDTYPSDRDTVLSFNKMHILLYLDVLR